MVNKNERQFPFWCVMEHARPVLVRALHAWGFGASAHAVAGTMSLGALKLTLLDVAAELRRALRFGPARRDLSNAVSTLHAAATLASRGDAENTAALVVGVFTAAYGALAWRRPWTRLRWRQRRADVILRARQEQNERRAGTGYLSPTKSSARGDYGGFRTD